MQQAFLVPLAPYAAQQTVTTALALYTFMSTRNGPNSQAVIAYSARQYENAAGQNEPLFVGRLTDKEVKDACNELKTVQVLTDKAVEKLDRRDFATVASYGTAVHMAVKEKIDAMKRADFRAEVSVLKTIDETGEPPPRRAITYGEPGSIRIDALENAKNSTACVYDVKTGKSYLLLGRSREIANAVKRNFPETHWIIVTQVKPKQ